MRRVVMRAAVLGALVWPLAACGLADSRSALPEFLRAKAADLPPPEAAPDVRRLVGADLDAIFVANSYPHDVRVSLPHRELRGTGWTACVQADVTSATGGALGPQIYRVMIEDSRITDRRRVGPDDNCTTEHYEPI